MQEKNIPKLCGARTRSGEPCRRRPTRLAMFYSPDKARCHLHGGSSLRGYAHPNYKHGRYSVMNRRSQAEAKRREKDHRNRIKARAEAFREFFLKHRREPNYEESVRIINNLKY